MTILLLLVGLLVGCASDKPPAPSPAPTLPPTQPGKLVRLVGNGTAAALYASGPGVDLPIHGPSGLAVGPDGVLLALQQSVPSLVSLSADGVATPHPIPDDGNWTTRYGTVAGFDSPAPAASASASRYTAAISPLGLSILEREHGTLVGSAKLPDAGGRSAAFLTFAGRQVLQFGTTWYLLGGLDSTAPTATVTPAPVGGTLAAAPTSGGSLVLTDTELVTLDGAGAITQRTAWTRPAKYAGQSLTAAVTDGRGGLFVAVADPPRSTSGAILLVRADGSTDAVADGHHPAQEKDCAASSTAALSSTLTEPTSLAVWRNRLVIADTGCNSILELALPS